MHLTSVPPEPDRPHIIAECHSFSFGGHLGITKTYHRNRQNYHWDYLKAQIQEHIRQCRICQLKKLVRLKTRQPMVLINTGAAFDKIALDIMESLPRTRHENGYPLMVIIQDILTKYSVAIPLTHFTAEATAAAFVNNFICKFGCPRAILTDQDTNFTGRQEIAKHFQIKYFKTTAYHPQSNGWLERSHHVLY